MEKDFNEEEKDMNQENAYESENIDNTPTLVDNTSASIEDELGETQEIIDMSSQMDEDVVSDFDRVSDCEEKNIIVPKKVKKKKSGMGNYFLKTIAAGLVFGFVAGGTMVGMSYFQKETKQEVVTENKTSTKKEEKKEQDISNKINIVKTSTDSIEQISANSISEIVKEVMPSIVSVNTVVSSSGNDYFGGSSDREGAGSGFVFAQGDGNLYVLTNYHVIEDAKSIKVTFDNDKSIEVKVKGFDKDEDIAVLEIKEEDLDKETLEHIKVSVIGDSESLDVGEDVIAIGNALGYGQSTTQGIVSALNREVELTDKTMKLIQTDASINPGNSGGALLNSKGEVIGINTLKVSVTGIEGMGYAIPINNAIEIAEKILNGEYEDDNALNEVYLGVVGGTIDSTMASVYEIPIGVYVNDVEAGSSAEEAGIEPGDIITEFNGQAIKQMEDLQKALKKCSPGDEVTIKIISSRDGGRSYREQKEVTVVLSTRIQ